MQARDPPFGSVTQGAKQRIVDHDPFHIAHEGAYLIVAESQVFRGNFEQLIVQLQLRERQGGPVAPGNHERQVRRSGPHQAGHNSVHFTGTDDMKIIQKQNERASIAFERLHHRGE